MFISVLVAGIPFHDNVFCVSNIHFTYNPFSLSLSQLFELLLIHVLNVWGLPGGDLCFYFRIYSIFMVNFIFVLPQQMKEFWEIKGHFVLDPSNHFCKMYLVIGGMMMLGTAEILPPNIPQLYIHYALSFFSILSFKYISTNSIYSIR